MNTAVLVLYVLNFAFVGALPAIFFRKGSFNPRWLLTASPFVVSPAFLILAHQGILPGWVEPGTGAYRAMEIAAIPFSSSE